MKREDIEDLVYKVLIDIIAEKVKEKLISREKKLLVVFTGAALGFSEALKGLKELKDKGFDGLFIDNVDVYYMYPSEESFEAITSILRALKAMGFYICINGGDVYVSECLEKFDHVDDIFDAVNQETVFTKIIWDEEDTFEEQDREESEYFQEYLKNVHDHGVDVYLLEYSKDKELAAKIKDYCREMGYNYYVSKTLNLDV